MHGEGWFASQVLATRWRVYAPGVESCTRGIIIIIIDANFIGFMFLGCRRHRFRPKPASGVRDTAQITEDKERNPATVGTAGRSRAGRTEETPPASAPPFDYE